MNKSAWILSDEEAVSMNIASCVMPSVEDGVAVSDVPAGLVTLSDALPENKGKTPVQQELFALDPENYDERQAIFNQYPQAIADFLAKATQKRVKTYGSRSAHEWLLQMHAQKKGRVQMVMQQYADVFALFRTPNYELQQLEEDEANAPVALKNLVERLENGKTTFDKHRLTPLCYLEQDQLRELAQELSTMFFSHFDERMAKKWDAMKAVNPDLTADDEMQLVRKVYLQAVEMCELIHIPAPQAKKARKRKIQIAEVINGALQLTTENWWFRKLRVAAKRMREHLAIAMGLVSSFHGGYVSNERLNYFWAQRQKMYDFLRSRIIINVANEEEQQDLLEIWKKTQSNPSIKRLELMNRMRGFENMAKEDGHEGVFVTLTAPSKYHAMLKSGGHNPKWNGAAPNQTQKYLTDMWKKVRAEYGRRGIKPYGFRIAEPHADATPHWHMVLFVLPEQMRELKRIIYHYALEEDGNEPGAKRHRCTFKKIDEKKGSATGYLMKYVAKNIDGKGMEELLSDETQRSAVENAERVTAWATLWGIRQFAQIGGASVQVYRELRKLNAPSEESLDLVDEYTERLRQACDEGNVALYTRLQGNGSAAIPRAEQKLRVYYVEKGVNHYGEPTKKIQGVKNTFSGKVTITRLKEWAITRKPVDFEEKQQAKAFARMNKEEQQKQLAKEEVRSRKRLALAGFNEEMTALLGELARPWTCVTKCTSSENVQVSQSIRDRLKSELVILKGRATDYDVTDLLKGKRLPIPSTRTHRLYVAYKRGGLFTISEEIKEF